MSSSCVVILTVDAPWVDQIPERDVVDHGRNPYGELLLDFLINANCCMLNGRNSKVNDFTSVSNKGKAVVDYAIVAHDSLPLFTEFEVKQARDLFVEGGCLWELDQERSISDHALLRWTLDWSSLGVDKLPVDQTHTEGAARLDTLHVLLPAGKLRTPPCRLTSTASPQITI